VCRGGAVTQDSAVSAGKDSSQETSFRSQVVVPPRIHATVKPPQPTVRHPRGDHVAAHPAAGELARRDHPELPRRNQRRPQVGPAHVRCHDFVLHGGTNSWHPAIVADAV
jgi:hypothetical protein